MSDPAESLPAIESPCIGTCTLGPDGLCVGCFRTAAEITAWLSFSPEHRRAVIEQLPARANALFDGD
ncbi:MAG: DUF1289 domain-containing protein [Wenzhouxiangella sp.]